MIVFIQIKAAKMFKICTYYSKHKNKIIIYTNKYIYRCTWVCEIILIPVSSYVRISLTFHIKQKKNVLDVATNTILMFSQDIVYKARNKNP